MKPEKKQQKVQLTKSFLSCDFALISMSKVTFVTLPTVESPPNTDRTAHYRNEITIGYQLTNVSNTEIHVGTHQLKGIPHISKQLHKILSDEGQKLQEKQHHDVVFATTDSTIYYKLR